jgi:DNA-binding NarL/FixJ family response regulator
MEGKTPHFYLGKSENYGKEYVKMVRDIRIMNCGTKPQNGHCSRFKTPITMRSEHIYFDNIKVTIQQARVISLCVQGLSRKLIADRLGITCSGVDSHLSTLFPLLRVQNICQLLVWALTHGFDAQGHLNKRDLMEGFVAKSRSEDEASEGADPQ